MLITNIKLYPMAGSVIENGYIRWQGSVITEVGEMQQLRFNNEETTLDYTGCIALPGLVDAHSHLGMFGDALGLEGDDGNEMTDPVTPQLRAIDAINTFDKGFEEALDYGVTTVLTGPGSGNAINGTSCVLKTSGVKVDDMVLLHPAAMKLALGENPKGVYAPRNQTPATRMGIAALIRDELRQALRYMEDLQASDEDDEVDPPDFDAKLEALLPVLRGELPVHIHCHRADDIFTAMRICEEFSLKGVLVHGTQAHKIAPYVKESGMPVICGPLLATRSKPELAEACRESPAILAQSGVEIAICTDHPELPQDCLMLSAALAHHAGLDEQAALSSITLTAAKICGVDHRIGSLAVGKDADILIYQTNPLKSITKPISVFINGNKVR